MKKKLVITVILMLTAFLPVRSQTAQTLPDIALESASGASVRSKSLLKEEKPLIITFWGTWCKPCIKEIDALCDLLVEYPDHDKIKVVAICVDDSRSSAKARAFAAGRGWDEVTILYDPRAEFQHSLNVNVVPYSFVFTSDGHLEYSHSGYTPGSESELMAKVSELLK